MQTKITLCILLIAVTVLSACSKMGALSSEYFTVTPSPLEASSGNVTATVSGLFPEKYVKKKATVTVTPVLRYAGSEVKGQPATFQGERVEGNNQTISYRAGGNYTMRSTFSYVEPMRKSELFLTFDARKGKKTYKVPDVKVADGVLATSQLVSRTVGTASTAYASDNFQRIIRQQQEANIQFLVNQAIIRTGELKSVSVQQFLATLKDIQADAEAKEMDNVQISSYASPEGALDFNAALAQNRGKSAAEFVNKALADNSLSAEVDTKFTAEDWEGFQQLVAKSNIQDKDVILRVLSMYTDPEEREAQIRNISAAYTELTKQVLPALRRSRIVLNYNLIGRSDEEIKAQYATDPAKLSVEELLYNANLAADDATRQDILQTITRLHPADYRAYNNLAAIAFRQGDYATAQQYIDKALSQQPAAAEANVNNGLLALVNGDANLAARSLGQGAEVPVLGEAMGNLHLMQGNYAQAVKDFGQTASNSAALAQLLSKDYLKAKTTLDNIVSPDAMTAYLKAIVAARTGDALLASDYLREAVAKDPGLAALAANDIEFANLNR